MNREYIPSIERWKGWNPGLYGAAAAQLREGFDFKLFIFFLPEMKKVSSIHYCHA